MTALIGLACVVTLFLTSLLVAYEWILAVAYAMPRQKLPANPRAAAMLVLIPAHDEEAGLPATLDSLDQVDYPRDRFRVVVVADRCNDATAAVARRCGAMCLDRFSGAPGKGAAIAWA